MNRHHAVIVGGGISGLSTAFFLSRRAAQEHLSLKITVLEASDRFGGVLRTLTHENLRMEVGADAFYAGLQKPAVKAEHACRSHWDSGQSDATNLCCELGLQEDLIEAAPCFRNFFGLEDKKFFPISGLPGSFSEAIRFLNSPRLNFFTKCRMLGEPFIPCRKEAGDESLASFIRRRLGQGFYMEVAKPLVQGVYMMDPERLSVDAMFPRLRQAERDYGSLARSFSNKTFQKKEKGTAEFLTLKDGLEGLIQAFVRKLGVCELRTSAPVRQCVDNARWEIFLGDGTELRWDI